MTEPQVFSPALYLLRTQDLLPPDDDVEEDDGTDALYARDCKTLDTDSLMLLVAERFSDSDALRALIEDTKRAPFTSHDRWTLHVSDAMHIGDALAAILADAMDEQVEMCLAGQEVRA